jgi:hypothetical protein
MKPQDMIFEPRDVFKKLEFDKVLDLPPTTPTCWTRHRPQRGVRSGLFRRDERSPASAQLVLEAAQKAALPY